MGGWRIIPNYNIAKVNPDWYWGMGNTAEAIVQKYNISRDDQDEFAYHSHMKAVNAISNGLFKNDIIPYKVIETSLDEKENKITKHFIFDTDEGQEMTQQLKNLQNLSLSFQRMELSQQETHLRHLTEQLF